MATKKTDEAYVSKFEHLFNLFDEVYVITDPEQLKCQVIEIRLVPGDVVKYTLDCNGEHCVFYEEELTKEKNLL